MQFHNYVLLIRILHFLLLFDFCLPWFLLCNFSDFFLTTCFIFLSPVFVYNFKLHNIYFCFCLFLSSIDFFSLSFFHSYYSLYPFKVLIFLPPRSHFFITFYLWSSLFSPLFISNPFHLLTPFSDSIPFQNF